MYRWIIFLGLIFLLTPSIAGQTLNTDQVGLEEGDIFTYEITNIGDNGDTIFQINGYNLQTGDTADVEIDNINQDNSEFLISMHHGGDTQQYRGELNTFSALFIFTDWDYWSSLIDESYYVISSSSDRSIIDNSEEFSFEEIGSGSISYSINIVYDKNTGATTFAEYEIESTYYSYDLIDQELVDDSGFGFNISPLMGILLDTAFIIGGVVLANRSSGKDSEIPSTGEQSPPQQSYVSSQPQQPTGGLFCSNCGMKNPPASNFCRSCGNKMS